VFLLHEVAGKTADQIVLDYPHLSLADVYAALAYYFDHQAEIKRQIKEDDDFIAALRAQTGPGPLETKRNDAKLKGLGDSSASVPS
jgi:hypothetical protein